MIFWCFYIDIFTFNDCDEDLLVKINVAKQETMN